MQKVDPFNLPSRPMTRPELQYWILFSMAVAGKGAKVTEQKMLDFRLERSPDRRRPGPPLAARSDPDLCVEPPNLVRVLLRAQKSR